MTRLCKVIIEVEGKGRRCLVSDRSFANSKGRHVGQSTEVVISSTRYERLGAAESLFGSVRYYASTGSGALGIGSGAQSVSVAYDWLRFIILGSSSEWWWRDTRYGLAECGVNHDKNIE